MNRSRASFTQIICHALLVLSVAGITRGLAGVLVFSGATAGEIIDLVSPAMAIYCIARYRL